MRKKSMGSGKWLRLLLAFSLLATVVLPLAEQPARAAQAGDLLAESFDGLSVGAQPTTGWTIPAAPEAVPPVPDPYISAIAAADDPGGAGRVLKLEKNGKSTATYEVKRSFTGVSKASFSYRVKAAQTNAIINLPSPVSTSASPQLVRTSLYNGNISIWKGGAWVAVQPYEANRWYDIRFALNTVSKKYDLYIDGVLKVAQEASSGSGTMSSIAFGVYKDSVGVAYFDDFNLYSYVPAVSASVYDSVYSIPQWETRQLTLDVQPSDATFRSALWTSSDPAIASVSANGLVTALQTGVVTITATPAEALPPVTVSVTVTPSQYTSPPGDVLSERFEAVPSGQAPPGWIVPAPSAAIPPGPVPYVNEAVIAAAPDGSGQALKLSKNTPSVATYTVRRNFTATAKAAMTYRVRAEQSDAIINLPSPIGTAASATSELVKMSLFNGTIAIWKNQVWESVQTYEKGRWYDIRFVLNTTTKTYDLYIDGVLKVAQEASAGAGQWTAVQTGVYRESFGTAYIDDLNIYSYKAPVSAAFAASQQSVPLHASERLALQFMPSDATIQSAAWSSNHPEIASVDISGLVTARAVGSATITAVPTDGLPAASVTVNVYATHAQSIALNKSALTMPVGSREQLTADIAPANSTDRTVLWQSANPAVATVDAYGEVTAVGPGQTTVSAVTAEGGIGAGSAVTVVARTVQQTYYVAPDGNDSQAGTAAAPFRTLERAREAVRSVNGQMTGDIVVYLREGVYTRSDAFALDDRDSGTNGHFVVYAAYPGERAVISGGLERSGWALHDAGQGIYKLFVGANVVSRQLFIDGVRAIRARSEAGLVNPVKTATGYTSDDTQLASYSRPSELEFVYFEGWTNPRVGVASIATGAGKAVITMKPEGWIAASNKGGTSVTVPAYYENAYELLDTPGEWYLDSVSGWLYYKPRHWESMATAKAVIPTAEKLLTVQGRSLDQPARNIRFEGLAFTDTTWLRPNTEAGHSDAQNNHLRYPGLEDTLPDAAITIERANTIDFERNEFRRLGITGLKLVGGVQNSTIRGNRFVDLSGSAVTVGEPDYRDKQVSSPDDPRLWMKNNDITDNYIHDIGIDFQSAAAVSAGFPVDMDISNNVMFSLPYSGTHVGYGWMTPFPSLLKGTKIEHNVIFDLMGRDVSDGGALYTNGGSGGSVAEPNLIASNYVRNQQGDSGVLYPDEGSSYWKFADNVIDLTESPLWHNSAPKWAHAWRSSIHDIRFDGNYTTTSLYRNDATNTTFTNTTVVPDAQWPTAAQSIIAQAGLTSAYSDITGGYAERLRLSELTLDIGQSAAASLIATNGKGDLLSSVQMSVYYRTASPAIASVQPDGTVTAVAKGRTTLYTDVVSDGILRQYEADIWVGDTLASIGLTGEAGTIVTLGEGESTPLQPYGLTELGRTVPLTATQSVSGRPDLFTIQSNGQLNALQPGVGALIVSGEYAGVRAETAFTVRIQEQGVAVAAPLHNELANAAGWNLLPSGDGSKTTDSEGITLSTAGGYSIYSQRKFQNELLDFDLTLNGTSGLKAFMLRNASAEQGYSGTTYLLVVKPDVLELQRFNNGVRTVLYGNISGSPSVLGSAIPNTLLTFGTSHRIKLGAVNEAAGVRLLLEVDGQQVINAVDTGSGALRKAGYFGVYAKDGSARLAKTPQAQQRLGQLRVQGAGALTVGDVSQTVVSAVYESGLPATVPAGIVYRSANAAVAEIETSGSILAKAAGTTVISATYGDLSGGYVLEVSAAAGRPGSGK